MKYAFLLLLASVAARAGEAASPPDGEALSACASAIFEEASAYSGRRDPKVVHVLPEGETARDETDRAHFSMELGGADWERIAPALGNLQTRLDARWHPPSDIAIPGVRVRVKEPRKDDFLGYRDFFFSFWPPGYDPANQVALVLAVFGPTPHGARAACHLRRQDEAWVVEKKWVMSWL